MYPRYDRSFPESWGEMACLSCCKRWVTIAIIKSMRKIAPCTICSFERGGLLAGFQPALSRKKSWTLLSNSRWSWLKFLRRLPSAMRCLSRWWSNSPKATLWLRLRSRTCCSGGFRWAFCGETKDIISAADMSGHRTRKPSVRDKSTVLAGGGVRTVLSDGWHEYSAGNESWGLVGPEAQTYDGKWSKGPGGRGLTCGRGGRRRQSWSSSISTFLGRTELLSVLFLDTG